MDLALERSEESSGESSSRTYEAKHHPLMKTHGDADFVHAVLDEFGLE